MSPREVDDLSLWEMGAVLEGWTRLNGGAGNTPPPSDEAHDALVEKYAHV